MVVYFIFCLVQIFKCYETFEGLLESMLVVAQHVKGAMS